LEAILISASVDPISSSSWALFNENLRNDPLMADAQITTYSYKPLVGISSQTDSNGQSIYYEYDDLGRLFRAMDSDGNLIQKIEYNYVNQ
jgi:YD repeat-containing protein